MKVLRSFRRSKTVEAPPVDDAFSSKANISVGVNGSSKETAGAMPIIPVPPEKTEEKVKVEASSDKIEYFKNNYLSIFGTDSIISSSGEVLKLNLLFAIYSELVNLRQDLAELNSAGE